jgi:plastocyanin
MKPTLIAVALSTCTLLAQAGTLQLVVTDRDGKPAADVVVLVESAARAVPLPAAVPVVIAQEGLRFVPFLTVVPAGSTLRFVNKDNYDHHVRSMPSGPLASLPPVKNFELRLDAAFPPQTKDDYGPARKPSGTSTADVKVEQSGPIALGCHLHSSMRGQVYVSGTPWFAKTDGEGKARIEGVPEGAAELTLWHPDQLQEQAAQRLQIGPAPVQATGQLNFTPRRRRS